ncbi:hypothetical protein ACQPYK_19005 [Streptosporangium sp. CA-135522]|uniref:hypothetical protein n=1 Tax=Streptosporangium sp. CA-135522 TaxID=3240072 RepID=UPI003D927E24
MPADDVPNEAAHSNGTADNGATDNGTADNGTANRIARATAPNERNCFRENRELGSRMARTDIIRSK